MPQSKPLSSGLKHSASFLTEVLDLVSSTQSAGSTSNMADPLSIAASSLGIANSTVSGLVAVYALIKQIRNAPEDAQMFLRLLAQVTEDFEYAIAFRRAFIIDRHHHRAGQQSIQDKWIYNVLIGTVEELDDFGKLVNGFGDGRTVDIKDKIRYVLKDAEMLKQRKDSLATAHNRLLAAITAMQLRAAGTQSAGLVSSPPLLHHAASEPVTLSSFRQRAPLRTAQMPSAADDEDGAIDKKGAYSDDDQETLF